MAAYPAPIGAVAMGCSAVALFFLRFWRQSLDRLFAFLALAFMVLAVNYLLMGLLVDGDEWRMIVDKNRRHAG